MDARKAILFDPETVLTLDRLVDEAWQSLSAERRERTTKNDVAQRLIRRAAWGVRDPARLRAYAAMEVVQDRDADGGGDRKRRAPAEAA
jgi:hypothetical protein